jgi:AcrR family transcriptional regulator
MDNYTTFCNLPEKKQKIILHAAIAEFSEHGYAKASCNRIVKQASISKGSLFQYFGSKEGLYSFVCGRFIRKVKDAVKHMSSGHHDFFDLIRGVLFAGIGFIDRYPEYFQIYLKIMVEHDVPGRYEFLQRVRLFSADYFGLACEEAMAKGDIRSDLSVEMIIFSIDATLDKFFLSYAGTGVGGLMLSGLSHAALTVKINELVAVLENGLKTVEQ